MIHNFLCSNTFLYFLCFYYSLFSTFNQLLSVGKRCHEAAKKRPNAGIPLSEHQLKAESNQQAPNFQLNFPDEGSVSINDLTINDPFVHLWPRILPSLMQCLDNLLQLLTTFHYDENYS